MGRARREAQRPRPGTEAPQASGLHPRPNGIRHLFAAYDLSRDKLYGHIKPKKTRTRFLEFCRYLRSTHHPETRIAIVLDDFSPHLTTKKDTRVGDWAEANNVEFAYTPTRRPRLARRRTPPWAPVGGPPLA